MTDRKMRRSDRELSLEEAKKVLGEALFGVYCTINADGSPYGVPLNFAYCAADNAIYVHGATAGHKIDNTTSNENVCFTAVSHVEELAEKFTTNYRSAIVFGKAHLVTEHDAKIAGLMTLIEKYSPDFIKSGTEYVHKAADATALIKIDIEKISGKERKGN